jgi:hypothetical protein
MRRALALALLAVPALAEALQPMGPAATPVTVPAALRARVPQVELSGIAWAAPLGRYLVVIDDSIDLRDDQRHAPFVLAMDTRGRLDPEPVPVDGVDAIADAEAIAAGAKDTFYLLTSHSPNKKGKLAKARRQLLQLHLTGRRLQVTGTLDLLDGAGGIGAALLKLHLPAGTDVDLEGVAFHQNALFIGLKAPLAPDGQAIILRLDRPAAAFTAGKLPPGALAPWATVELRIESGGLPPDDAPVHQGIADLFFGPDGTLFLCANAPKGGPSDGGGALWRVDKPAPDRMTAHQLQHFTGFKPEGVTVAPDGKTLTVVFDRGRHDPLWLSRSLGR